MFNNVLCVALLCLSKVEMSKVFQQLCVFLAADKVEGAHAGRIMIYAAAALSESNSSKLHLTEANWDQGVCISSQLHACRQQSSLHIFIS